MFLEREPPADFEAARERPSWQLQCRVLLQRTVQDAEKSRSLNLLDLCNLDTNGWKQLIKIDFPPL